NSPKSAASRVHPAHTTPKTSHWYGVIARHPVAPITALLSAIVPSPAKVQPRPIRLPYRAATRIGRRAPALIGRAQHLLCASMRVKRAGTRARASGIGKAAGMAAGMAVGRAAATAADTPAGRIAATPATPAPARLPGWWRHRLPRR